MNTVMLGICILMQGHNDKIVTKNGGIPTEIIKSKIEENKQTKDM